MEELNRLFDQIARAKKELNFQEGEECFFRGHANSDWDLAPTLFRKKYDEDDDEFWTEASLFWEFGARAKQLHSQHLDDWDILFYMRHHGVPTRLIDWTETIGVALYFAIVEYKENIEPCLWVLNPYALNKKNWGVRDLISPRFLLESEETDSWSYGDFMATNAVDFQWENPVAIYPPQKSDRVQAQRGWFTIHGTNTQPLNKIDGVDKFAKKIVIQKSMIQPIRDFLEAAGINDHIMFPDLDGLSKYLRKKYKF